MTELVDSLNRLISIGEDGCGAKTAPMNAIRLVILTMALLSLNACALPQTNRATVFF